MAIFPLPLLLAGLAAAPLAAQVAADADFDTAVARPAFAAGKGPRLLFDEAHRNLHTAAGRYAAMAAVATADGFRVEPGRQSFAAGSLPEGGILLIANARGEQKETDPAFRADEIAVVKAWVEEGGSLLLIADHTPYGSAAASLAAAFGIAMHDGAVDDAAHQAPGFPGPAFLLFSRDNGLLGRHPILEGRAGAEGEKIERVITFGGQALEAGEGIAELLVFGPDAVLRSAGEGGIEKTSKVGGLAQIVAFEKGEGRVVVAGEAGLFAAQVIRGEQARNAGLPDPFRFGMTCQGCDNKQLLLNTLRWLARQD